MWQGSDTLVVVPLARNQENNGSVDEAINLAFYYGNNGNDLWTHSQLEADGAVFRVLSRLEWSIRVICIRLRRSSEEAEESFHSHVAGGV